VGADRTGAAGAAGKETPSNEKAQIVLFSFSFFFFSFFFFFFRKYLAMTAAPHQTLRVGVPR